MKITTKLIALILCSRVVAAEIDEKRIDQCLAEDGKTQVSLLRSTVKEPTRSLWIEKEGVKEVIWENTRKPGLSIATNRGVFYREHYQLYKEALNSGKIKRGDKLNPELFEFLGQDPDPYETMELVKVALTEDVLVMITRTKLQMNEQHEKHPSYVGGFFFDHLFEEVSFFCSLYGSGMPPHSNYSLGNFDKIKNFRFYKAPWSKEHKGYEYFMRSFVKATDGKWNVHVNAALSVLWADSLGLPIFNLVIEDKDTYSATFKGKYKYYTIDAKAEIDKLYESKVKGVDEQNVLFFDDYGSPELLKYKGEILEGETVEKIKFKAPAPVNSTTKEKHFNSIYTTFNGSKEFYRLAYDKDAWRVINSWQGYDELNDDQVTKRPSAYGSLSWSLIDNKIGYGGALPGYELLAPNEVRQTYCLDIELAKSRLSRRMLRIAKTKKPDRFNESREKMYLRLIEEALEKEGK